MSKIWFNTQLLAAFLVALALTLGGCGGSGSSSSAVAPPVVEEPVVADPPPAVPQNAPVARTDWAVVPTVVIEDADVAGDGTLSVVFNIADQDGAPITNITSGLSFIVAQLVPDGSVFKWQSYINRLEAPAGTSDVGAAVDGTAVFGSAIQATLESNGTLEACTSGTFGNTSDVCVAGQYRYIFAKNLNDGPFWPLVSGVELDPALDLDYTFIGDAALVYDATRTHRVAIQLSRVTPATRAPANAWLDFVPNGDPVTQTKNVATTQSCNSCHDGRLAIHGGNRLEVEYCVTCHNPGTVDANSGFNLDMANMIHKIHRGANLPSVQAGGEYAIWGFGSSKHDYSAVHYPTLYYQYTGEPLNCTTCHTAANTATPDGDNWFRVASRTACFSCHDELVEGKTFAYNNGGTYSRHAAGGGDPFPDQIDIPSAASCGGCHTGDATLNLRRTVVAHSHDFDRPQFRYIINEVTLDGNKPVVTFKIQWRENSTGTFADLDLAAADLPSVTPIGGTEPVALAGGPNLALIYSTTGADWDLNRPNGQPETVSLANLRNGTGGTLVANGDGTFTATLNAEYPAGATRRAVFMQGYFTLDGKRLDTPSPLVHVSTDIPRRQIVAQDKCLGCHGGIGFHGGNRVDNPQVCAGCHNQRLTSSGHLISSTNNSLGRTGEPEDEVTNNLKDMIHGIHAGTLVGGRNQGSGLYYDFTTIHYPGVLSNCLACHNEGTYEQPVANAAVTTNLTMDRTSAAPGEDDRVTSPYAASCVGCHNSTAARNHIDAAGGWVREKRSDVQATEGGCVLCHGPGATIAPVSGVHSGLQ